MSFVDPLPKHAAARGFLALLDSACANIAERWFLLPVDSSDATASRAVYRERVYCYELYHQLRTLSDSSAGIGAGASHYLLSGEIDKAGLNAMIVRGREKPVLVWHVPGTSRNAVVIEVKAAFRRSSLGLVKDLKTLSKLLSVPDRAYECGVLLVYGDLDRDDLKERVRIAVARAQVDPGSLRNARLLWHPKAGSRTQDLGAITTQGRPGGSLVSEP